MGALLDRARRAGATIEIPAGVVAQVWRGGARQARLAHFIFGDHAVVVPMDVVAATKVGMRCGISGHSDIADVHVAVHAEARTHTVVTSDPDDLAAIAPGLPMIVV